MTNVDSPTFYYINGVYHTVYGKIKDREKCMTGILYLVATPIGNLKDITLRAIEVLQEVDWIAAEDTRNTIKLLNHYNIKKSMIPYHKFNQREKGKEIIKILQTGQNIALVSDAGMPSISDPGEELVRMCYEFGIKVSVIPGACACVSALAISGLATQRFAFESFLPYDKKQRKQILEELRRETRTIILYEAPHKVLKTLKELSEYLGGTRKCSFVREITKHYEEVIQISLEEAIQGIENNAIQIRGEYVLVIEGIERELLFQEKLEVWKQLSLQEHMQLYEQTGMSTKEAMKRVAKERGISKREVYQELLTL